MAMSFRIDDCLWIDGFVNKYMYELGEQAYIDLWIILSVFLWVYEMRAKIDLKDTQRALFCSIYRYIVDGILTIWCKNHV